MRAWIIRLFRFLPLVFMWTKNLFHVKQKTIAPEKKWIDREVVFYKSLGEVQSPQLCKYVMNRVITELERLRADFDQTAPYIDLNDRNSGKYLGRISTLSDVLLMIRQYIEDYWGNTGVQ
jgi:hypothetical protein